MWELPDISCYQLYAHACATIDTDRLEFRLRYIVANVNDLMIRFEIFAPPPFVIDYRITKRDDDKRVCYY